MTIEQVRKFFMDKENTPCPLTEKLVKAGYQQTNGGYINNAIKAGMGVDYKQNKPSQYWHLMSYCNSRESDKCFSRSIVCGELIFWMAEVSGCVSKSDLQHIVEEIISSGDHRKEGKPTYDRIKWNKVIQNLCFDKIALEVEKV